MIKARSVGRWEVSMPAIVAIPQVVKDMMMSQNAAQRLYLMQVGIMPEYQIPIVCYLVQTGDGKNILIDTGLPEIMPEEETDFENGQDVIEQLAKLGLKPDDID